MDENITYLKVSAAHYWASAPVRRLCGRVEMRCLATGVQRIQQCCVAEYSAAHAVCIARKIIRECEVDGRPGMVEIWVGETKIC